MAYISRKNLKLIVASIVLIVVLARYTEQFFVNPALVVGPRTTVISEPLSPNGTIDYAAALHQTMSEGINRDNNAAVLLDQVIGLEAIPAELRSRYSEWMGVQPFDEQDVQSLSQTNFIALKIAEVDPPAKSEMSEKLDVELTRINRPWARSDCPLACEWYDANVEAFPLIERALQRPCYYSPRVTNSTLLEAQNNIQAVREIARLLIARAMSRLHADDIDGTVSDLLACHRLARMVAGRTESMIDLMVAFGIDAATTKADQSLIEHGMPVETARRYLADYDRLSDFSRFEKVIDRGQRFEALDTIQKELAPNGLDANTSLRSINEVLDQVVEGFGRTSFGERRDALTVVENQVARAADLGRNLWIKIPRWIVFPRRTLSDSIGQTMFALLMPAFNQANITQTRSQVRRDQVRIGIALAAFRAERGVYPDSLDQLRGDYLEEVPLDRFADQPYVYSRSENGFRLYSLGANGKDDQGQERGLDLDDATFEVPRRVDE